jgi:hypothetical protein
MVNKSFRICSNRLTLATNLIASALKTYIRSLSYLEMLKAGSARIDLEGNLAEADEEDAKRKIAKVARRAAVKAIEDRRAAGQRAAKPARNAPENKTQSRRQISTAGAGRTASRARRPHAGRASSPRSDTAKLSSDSRFLFKNFAVPVTWLQLSLDRSTAAHGPQPVQSPRPCQAALCISKITQLARPPKRSSATWGWVSASRQKFDIGASTPPASLAPTLCEDAQPGLERVSLAGESATTKKLGVVTAKGPRSRARAPDPIPIPAPPPTHAASVHPSR